MEETKRRRYFIQKGFQLRMFVRFMLMVILSTVLTGGLIIGLTAYKQKKDKAKLFYVTDSFGTDPKVITEMDKVKAIAPVVGITLIVSIFITGIFVLFYSHKIAGPVCKITKCLEQMEKGQTLEKINLRESDEFRELAEAYNKAVENMKTSKGIL
ncbi:MAG: methyl-accepting chemotaxis protein [Elusimicrobiota bacterium]